MDTLAALRDRIRALHLADEKTALDAMVRDHGLTPEDRAQISADAAALITDIRAADSPGLMEVFLAEYGLSTDEGIALMCLAEALLRVPDAQTIDDLIEDKIAPSAWGAHLGQSSSSLVNASTWALMLTGKVLREPQSGGLADTLHAAVRRLGEPVIRVAVKRIMKEMGHQFVLGQDIDDAIRRAAQEEAQGFTYSYDMLGEAALTAADAETYFDAYRTAITALTKRATHQDIRQNPGISIKLSALHPRYEEGQRTRVMAELVPRVAELARLAQSARMGLNIDAEEADRLELSLDVIEAVLGDPALAEWPGFGVVVQAYSKRAPAVIDWLYALGQSLDRQIMVRLVKGAYWDTEIKRAQVDGVTDFPVFTRKAATDVSYLSCARQLLGLTDRIYPQFATHNAHTVAAILHMGADPAAYEFQRLHGMGEALHRLVMDRAGTRCRIYAPVGAHRDLLAYLVRRLLENGANSSFVNQILDDDIAPEEIARDPYAEADAVWTNAAVIAPSALFLPERVNSQGWDLRNRDHLVAFETARAPFHTHQWRAGPVIAGRSSPTPETTVSSPSDSMDIVGHVALASAADVDHALDAARPWTPDAPETRARVLKTAADLYEANAGKLFAALAREAGKTPTDAVAELREAVDFLRYYASEIPRLPGLPPRGTITCISPWNFPLAIFTGQVAAALAAGNAVLAKPAEPTPLIASIAVRLLHEAGVPFEALQLLPGTGPSVGVALTTDPRVDGIAFTGSTAVAQAINRGAAATMAPDAALIAETGGINAMIVDSTALPEQAIKDIVEGAFRSCGQRCSALRMLYVQEDIAEDFLRMLFGAMDELWLGDPWSIASDVGPVITPAARDRIATHIAAARDAGRLLKEVRGPEDGLYLGPAVIEVTGIDALAEEIFGPVLHVATFKAEDIDQIVSDINACGYGLTFGLHTRIDDRVDHITRRLSVGNLYINRNQIGAIVGSQPFGGEGLSGTGPKAGGPHYVRRFLRPPCPRHAPVAGDAVSRVDAQRLLDAARTDTQAQLEARDLPGPTGESNRWTTHPRGTILCLGPSAADARAQMEIAQAHGCAAVGIAPGLAGAGTLSGLLDRSALTELTGFAAVALWSDRADLSAARVALAARDGPLLPLIATDAMAEFCVIERHLCIDTTAAGGNASLLAAE